MTICQLKQRAVKYRLIKLLYYTPVGYELSEILFLRNSAITSYRFAAIVTVL